MDLTKPPSDQCRPAPKSPPPQLERCLFIGGPDDGKLLDVPIGQGWAESARQLTVEQAYVERSRGVGRTHGRYMRCDLQLSAYPSVRAALYIYSGMSPDDAFKQLIEHYMSPMKFARIQRDFIERYDHEYRASLANNKTFSLPALPAAAPTSDETTNKTK